ncbi:MAG: TetR/AcrR family transcriptional regulator [Desulfobacterales bacterium]|nr:TetR/AcrR family transcriptional regulator [Desulfobacterales bacterium]MCP4163376.1 TetR/AcrR family transcriptional regulator [Deltaproteobacteria bacterium]
MPKVVDHDKFREELLTRCFNIFSQKGYSKVSIREIAKETGVSTGTLYHYFKNKENILEQLFSSIRRRNFDQYLAMTENVDNKEDRFKLITNFWKEHIEEYQKLFLLAIDYMRTKDSKKALKVFHDFADFYIKVLTDNLEIPVKSTEILYTYLTGLVFNSLITPDIIKPDEHIDMINKILLIMTEKNSKDEDSFSKLKSLIK